MKYSKRILPAFKGLSFSAQRPFLFCAKAFLFLTTLIPITSSLTFAQEAATFEMRYFTSDPKANGVTDFHGETEWLTTEQRVEMLNQYADYASRYWGDPQLSTPLFTDEEVERRLAEIKPQPTTAVRQTIPLREWKACGYKKGKETEVAERWRLWTADGARIQDGCLVLDGASASPHFNPLAWRFRLSVWLAAVPQNLIVRLTGSGGGTFEVPIEGQTQFEIYGDMPNRRLFLSSAGKTLREATLPDSFGNAVTACALDARNGQAQVDRLWFYDFVNQFEKKHTPYRSDILYHEDFNAVPQIQGWTEPAYDDSGWELVTLPSPHGGASEKGESYYLRTKVHTGDFQTASLEIETIDPAGEVWVNGEPVAVTNGRLPQHINVAEYLRPNAENTIAVRVKPYYAHNSMLHTPSDHNIGWFLGRTALILCKEQCTIRQGLVHTLRLSDKEAVQHHRITLENPTADAQKRQLQIRYTPWFPKEGECVAVETKDIILLPQMENHVDIDITLKQPQLWSPQNPRLYRVEFILRDEKGNPTDDWQTTTGVRLIRQREGVLYINNRPEMLGGAQNFGYRLPVETVARTVRCASDAQVLRELMMVRAMNGNLLRIHVHSEGYTQDGINDPRFAEYADQLGLYLIWQTPGWIREGETSIIDVKNYPIYMRQVFNHPSIAIWEGSNHPNRYKEHPSSESTRFFGDMARAMLETDSSRLASPSSHWQNSHINSYDATVDYQGKPMQQPALVMHPMMTRGNQDAYSGYSNDWSRIRGIPFKWARQCLEAKGLCYFNFEHEESIGQPNWSLARKEPWFEVKSYEWDYSEGNVGRQFETSEWRASQAYQAFGAWESMKMQILWGTSGFSWCSLESGPNMFTYLKPLVDPFCVPKLAFHANRMAFQRLWAGSDDVDTVYGPDDTIRPVIFNLDEACTVTLTVELQNAKGRTLEKKTFKNVQVPAGRSVTRLEPFRFRKGGEGCRFLVYRLSR
ncbi:MAG: glycosyl hydrolase family 2 [Bacteroidaceae bacterium]|nr:glycosyl hydrolase family 2 [Bacteroidaceae bacterium]